MYTEKCMIQWELVPAYVICAIITSQDKLSEYTADISYDLFKHEFR